MMKLSTKWAAALLAVVGAPFALAGPAMGPYGPFGTEGAYGGPGPYAFRACPRLVPVGERVVVVRRVIVKRPVIHHSRCFAMTSCPRWVSPAPVGEALGDMVAAPFRLAGSTLLWTGRTLSAPLAPVGERCTVIRERTTMLVPVGEKTVITKTALPGNRMMARKTTFHHKKLVPVGERIGSCGCS